MFPQPCFSDIEKLEIVNKDFEDHISKIDNDHPFTVPNSSLFSSTTIISL